MGLRLFLRLLPLYRLRLFLEPLDLPPQLCYLVIFLSPQGVHLTLMPLCDCLLLEPELLGLLMRPSQLVLELLGMTLQVPDLLLILPRQGVLF